MNENLERPQSLEKTSPTMNVISKLRWYELFAKPPKPSTYKMNTRPIEEGFLSP
jgi:hypothetical protein